MKKNYLPLIVIFSVFIICSFFLIPSRSAVKKAPAKIAVKPAIVIPIASSTAAATGTPTSTATSTGNNSAVAVAKTKTAAAYKTKTAATAKTTTKKKSTSSSGVQWTSSGLRAIGSLASFDYSYSIRAAYMAKVVSYARRNGIRYITASVVNSMHE